MLYVVATFAGDRHFSHVWADIWSGKLFKLFSNTYDKSLSVPEAKSAPEPYARPVCQWNAVALVRCDRVCALRAALA